MTDCSSVEQVAQIVIRGLAAGKVVEIDGLGSFVPDAVRGFRFEPRHLPQVFVAHVKEDVGHARGLCDALEEAGFNPWMDERKLLPGQNWPRAIEAAIETSDFFLACYSENSVNKKGGFQAEIRYALDCARQIPLDEIFIVPVRLTAAGCRDPSSANCNTWICFPTGSTVWRAWSPCCAVKWSGGPRRCAREHRHLPPRAGARWPTGRNRPLLHQCCRAAGEFQQPARENAQEQRAGGGQQKRQAHAGSKRLHVRCAFARLVHVHHHQNAQIVVRAHRAIEQTRAPPATPGAIPAPP